MKRIEEEKLIRYLLGETSEVENAEIEAILAGNSDQARELEELLATLKEGLQQELPRVRLDRARRHEILEAAGEEASFSFSLGKAAIAAAVMIGVLFVTWSVLHHPTSPGELALLSEESGPARDLEIEMTPIPREEPSLSADQATRNSHEGPDQSADELGREAETARRSARTRAPAAPQPLRQRGVTHNRGAESAAGFTSAVAQSESLPAAATVQRISGVVRDETGGSIPGADVRVRDESGKTVAFTTTDDQGRFEIAGLAPGHYELEISLSGFKTITKSVEVGGPAKHLELALKLEIGEMAETLEVTADSRIRKMELRESEHTMFSSPLPSALGDAVRTPPRPSEDWRYQGPFNTEEYDHLPENPFIRVADDPLSTFSIDVDTASYANLRRFLNQRQLPPKDAVRIEEMVNYFPYDYEPPQGEHPFAVHLAATTAPWNAEHRLVRIGLKGKEIPFEDRKPGNFVFLLDVSGSMQSPHKLPLLKRAMKLLVDKLTPEDRVAIVVYAGSSGLVLPSTRCDEKETILSSLERLRAGGSTNGGQGIELAYQVAKEHFIEGGVNRVLLATDGDFNVGVTNQGALVRLIQKKAKEGIFLTVLGFGMGNYNDSTLEKLADEGNGNYAYIDTLSEARKVLVEQISGTLLTIAKDVKLQLEFNPYEVEAYRLIGYENRLLRHQDFNDDTKDAGEIGSGHTVTALYELVPRGVSFEGPGVDPLKYQRAKRSAGEAYSGELFTVKLRYKEPAGETSRLLEETLRHSAGPFSEAPEDFRFAASVAAFGMLLRESEHSGSATYASVLEWAEGSLGMDRGGYRSEFLKLVRTARALEDLEALEEQ